MDSTHPVLRWPLDGFSYDVVIAYKVRQNTSDVGIQQIFRCSACDYMGFYTESVRLVKERQLLIVEKYDSCELAPTQPILIGRLLVPIEEIITIIAQRREESYGEPDKLGPLLYWPKESLPFIRELITAGFKP